MNVQEAIDLAQLSSDEKYDTSEWVQWMNEALDDLTPVAKQLDIAGNIAVTLTDGKGEIAIANDVTLQKAHEIVNVYYVGADNNHRKLRRLPINDYYSKGWRLANGKILIQGLKTETNITCDVDIYKRLAHVVALTDTFEIPEQYHTLISMYIIAKSQQKEEELEDKFDFFRDYTTSKQRFAVDRIWEMEPQNRHLIKQYKLLGVK